MKRILLLTFCLSLIHTSFSQDFVTRDGNKLKFQGEEIMLQGMSFGNLVWEDAYSPDQHHSEIDYQRLQELDMNVIRFYMNYKTFEDDTQPYEYKQSGWDWIDQNVQWAKDHNIFLILNMHVPQGGFQSRCEGDALWEVGSNQDRLVSLWQAIAERYKNEPQIAGYDLLNEPIPTESVQSWTDLAQRMIDSIRKVDTNHLIITERAIALDCDYNHNDGNNNYPQVTEENLMFTVHMYDPFEFTHQNLSWAETGDGGKYPDENTYTLPADLTYGTGDYNTPSIADGTTDWTYFEGTPFTITNSDLLAGRVVFLSEGINTGTVYFDDFKLVELDENNDTIRTIYEDEMESGNFWWWSENEDGDFAASGAGHGDNYAVSVSGNTGPATVICHEYTFRVHPGRKYVVSGWMKGDNIPAGATASISTEYYVSPSGGETGARNYQYLVESIVEYAEYIEVNNYPVYFGEFGAARTCFVDDKGGDRWVADVLHIFDSLGYHFTYHSYKESAFGYYDGWEHPVDPSTVNVRLKQVFEDFFANTTVSVLPKVEEKELQLFPNPAKDIISLQVPDHLNVKRALIYSQEGKILKEIRDFSGTVNTGNLSPGIYFISVETSEGNLKQKFTKAE